MKKKKSKKVDFFLKYIAPIQPFLLGALLLSIAVNAYLKGEILHTFLSFLVGFLVAAYFYQQRLGEAYRMLDTGMEASQKSFKAIVEMLDHLREHADIDIEMVTNDEELEELMSAVNKKGGEKNGKSKIVN